MGSLGIPLKFMGIHLISYRLWSLATPSRCIPHLESIWCAFQFTISFGSKIASQPEMKKNMAILENQIQSLDAIQLNMYSQDFTLNIDQVT